VTIDDAAPGDSVGSYILKPPEINIGPVAIVPIGRNDVRGLIVLDKVPPNQPAEAGSRGTGASGDLQEFDRAKPAPPQRRSPGDSRHPPVGLGGCAHLFRNPPPSSAASREVKADPGPGKARGVLESSAPSPASGGGGRLVHGSRGLSLSLPAGRSAGASISASSSSSRILSTRY
jgi:hypothetical protein